jgi:hypothetical protein
MSMIVYGLFCSSISLTLGVMAASMWNCSAELKIALPAFFCQIEAKFPLFFAVFRVRFPGAGEGGEESRNDE